MSSRWRGITFWIVAGLACLLSAEVTARVEDYLRHDVSLLAVPDHDRDLVLHDELGIRGRPDGRFKKWQLNGFGFRGSEIAATPAPGCKRVAVLGASETLGLYESAGKEYPAQLAVLLRSGGCYEVINAGVAGLNLLGIKVLWENWVSRFGPDTVVIYPTPAFYLSNNPPTSPGSPSPERPPSLWWPPRLLQRAQDVFEWPKFVHRRLVLRTLAARQVDTPGWVFENVPEDRLRQFQENLGALIDSISARGATPAVMTHATGFVEAELSQEQDELNAWRQFEPRATARVLLDFEARAAEAVREIARDKQIAVIDLAATMNGKHAWFADDYLHFSDEGAAMVARLISQALLPSGPGGVRK